MQKCNWTSSQTIADVSPYVRDLLAPLKRTIPRVRSMLSTTYFQNFCMKAATAMLASLLKSVYKCNNISSTGAAQLQLDLNGIKEFLLALPNYRVASESEPINMGPVYGTFVSNKAHEIDVVLKLVATDDDKINEVFALLWPDGTREDLRKVNIFLFALAFGFQSLPHKHV